MSSSTASYDIAASVATVLGWSYFVQPEARYIESMNCADESSHLEAMAALEQFVVENDDLLELETLIGRFNIFDALRIDRAEIRHSNFLAFILDPAESHGLSQLFLKALLMDLLKSAPVNLRPFSPIEIDGSDLRGVTVRREWHSIDLLIACERPAFVIAIENKIDAREHSDQLLKYQRTIEKHYHNVRTLFVFLTPDGADASENQWVSYTYADVHRVLSRVRNTYANAIGDDVLIFLDHYLNLIGTRLMDDAKIDELCRRIFNNHRLALQLIFDRAGSPASGILADVETVIQEDQRWNVFYRTGRLLDFVPKSWMDWLPPLGLDHKEHPKSWFVFRFLALDDRLDYYAEIRRMSDLNLRRAIIEMLFAEGTNFGLDPKKVRKPTDSWTRISRTECIANWRGDEGPDSVKIREAVKKKLDQLYPKLDRAPDRLRELCARAPNGQVDRIIS